MIIKDDSLWKYELIVDNAWDDGKYVLTTHQVETIREIIETLVKELCKK